MDESEKLRMNLVAIQKVDPYAKEILDSCSHVAFYKYINNEWEKSEIEGKFYFNHFLCINKFNFLHSIGSFFVYSRVAEPFHSIFINNRLNTNSLVEPITKPIELQSQPPFLLYRNQRSAISGFWFYCKEDCVRIHGLLEKLIKKCNTNITKSDQVVTHHPLPQQQQHHHQQTSFQNIQGLNGNSNSQKKDVDIFSMLTKAQAEFTSSNGPPNLNLVAVEQKFSEMQMNPIQVIQQQQQQQPSAPSHHHHQPLMKQISSAMPDITSPNVVSFFAAAQQPNANGVVLDGHHQIIQPQGQPHFLANPHQIVQQPPVQTLDEIEKQHRVSSISPKVGKCLLFLIKNKNNLIIKFCPRTKTFE